MQPPLFYAPPESRVDNEIVLPDDEARHAVKVLRLKSGTIIIVMDGLGNAFRAELTFATVRKVTAIIHSQLRDYGETTVNMTLAAGLSVGSKFDDIVKRGTELGVRRFVPLISATSKVSLEDPRRARARVTRLERVAMAAIKQSRRSILPRIALPISFDDFLAEYNKDDTGLIFAVSRQAKKLHEIPLEGATKRITLMVGPESGFSGDEVARAEAAGLTPVSLGPRVLRTETAGSVVVALVMDRLGELR